MGLVLVRRESFIYVLSSKNSGSYSGTNIYNYTISLLDVDGIPLS